MDSKHGMSDERYYELMESDNKAITIEEQKAGWHWCPEYDFLLMNINDHEAGCSCKYGENI